MPRDLFGDVARPSISIGNRKWYTVPLSLFTHSLAVGLLVALPLLAPAVMPAVFADDDPEWIAITPPAPPPRPRPAALKPITNPGAAPALIPDGITPEKPVDFDTTFQETDTPGIVGGVDNIDSVITPPPAPRAALGMPAPVRVGSGVKSPRKTRDVQPKYPPLAQTVGVEGVVIIEATIGIDGRLINAKVLRSIPLLDQAALDAVRQWEFTPSLLNGVPVPVIMTITVNFTLRR
jgi:protein TonB